MGDSSPAAQFDLRASEILNSVTDAVATFDREWRFTYLNDQAARMLSRTRGELLGQSVWDVFPETVGTASFTQFHPPLGIWFQVRAYPSPDDLSVFFQDISEQTERARRERFLADLAERARTLTDPDEVIGDAVRAVGEFFGVSRCIFADIEADTCGWPRD